MSYFEFLLLFLIIPIVILLGLAARDKRVGRERSAALRSWPFWRTTALLIAMAVIYTTPWDNYLVATRVWWYDEGLVTGPTLGWVPIEEYTFFILQPILGGLWLLFLSRRMRLIGTPLHKSLRLRLTALMGIVWLGVAAVLISGWQPGTYMALELVWALPPIVLQLAFGADILWRYRRLIFLSIVPLTLFLSTADALAINRGIWTINPAKSLNILIGGVLPLEELLFFLLTNILIAFGLVLIWAEVSLGRLQALKLYLSSGIYVKPVAGSNTLNGSTGHAENINIQEL